MGRGRAGTSVPTQQLLARERYRRLDVDSRARGDCGLEIVNRDTHGNEATTQRFLVAFHVLGALEATPPPGRGTEAERVYDPIPGNVEICRGRMEEFTELYAQLR